MNKATMIVATLAASALSAAAGTPAPVSTGKAPVACPAPMDPCAGPISYNNVELMYAYTDLDDFNDEANGGVLRFEYSPLNNLYFTGSGEYHEAGDLNMWVLSGGVGGYVPLTENIHLAADAGVLWASVDVDSTFDTSASNGYSDDEVGWYVRPHLRAKWGCLEVHAGAQYSSIDDTGFDEWSAFANLYYQVSPGWDLAAGVILSSERTTATGGVRYRF